MTYLPELRASLVDAAERQATGVGAEPARRRVRRRGARPFGAFALMAASVVAIVVAGAVLVLVRHGGSTPPEAGQHPAATHADLESAALSVLTQFTPPVGAVRVPINPAPGSEIRRPPVLGPPGGLSDRHVVDQVRFYRVPGALRAVINAVTSHPPIGVQSQSSAGEAEASSSSDGHSQSRTTFLAAGFSLPTVNGIDRQLTVAAVPLRGGGTGLRVDAQAGYGRIQTPHLPTQTTTPALPPGVVDDGGMFEVNQPAVSARAARFLRTLPLFRGSAPACTRTSTRILLDAEAESLDLTLGCPVVSVIDDHFNTALKAWPLLGTLRGSGEITKVLQILTG